MEAIRKLQDLPLTMKESDNIEARGECRWPVVLDLWVRERRVRLSHISAIKSARAGRTRCDLVYHHPHCMRFLAPQTLDQQVMIAQAFGIKTDGRRPEDVAAEAANVVERSSIH